MPAAQQNSALLQGSGAMRRKQRYRLLLHFVPGVSPALRVLHSEHVPVVIVPVKATKQVSVTGALCSGYQRDTATAVIHTVLIETEN